ncbi:oxidoreductase [Pseudonocardia sp. N23]|uniref:oxidoreductase n=1 Tax=Pseudonocardia sp. N23 TaxID=1987376 RepID=UPI000BFDAEA2|nr:oxidoreductase [Pseudonocardia sp. N23]GAY08501.1 putative short chain dehydrogenase [Pseudonocardia sp. N23]
MISLPDQTGRTVLVTGATSGLGLASAVAFAGAGARVLMTARDPERGAAALERVRAESGGIVELVDLDLADLHSVHAAAADVRERTGDRLHVLMNNAGVMATPRGSTVDGFELQIGTNHLGPAALTWLLMPALRAAGTAEEPSRVVTVSSIAHNRGGLDPDDLAFERRRYSPAAGYGASKLANLLFTAELDRRLRAAGDPVISVAAHPGSTQSELLGNSLRQRSPLLAKLARPINAVVTQPVATGVLPQLAAATSPQVEGGDYIGPRGPFEIAGRPGPARRSGAAHDPGLARRLWDVTAVATGVQPDPR